MVWTDSSANLNSKQYDNMKYEYKTIEWERDPPGASFKGMNIPGTEGWKCLWLDSTMDGCFAVYRRIKPVAPVAKWVPDPITCCPGCGVAMGGKHSDWCHYNNTTGIVL